MSKEYSILPRLHTRIFSCIIAAACTTASLLNYKAPTFAQSERLHVFKVQAIERKKDSQADVLLVTAEIALISEPLEFRNISDNSSAILTTSKKKLEVKPEKATGDPSVVIVFDAGRNLQSSSDPATFERMKSAIGQFATDVRLNIGIVAAKDSPLQLNGMQKVSKESLDALTAVSAGSNRSCINPALQEGLRMLTGAPRPRMILLIAAGPDMCNPEGTLQIAREAHDRDIEINAFGLLGTAASENNLRHYVSLDDVVGGVHRIIDNSNGGNLRDALKAVVLGYGNRRLATWEIFPEQSGRQSNSITLNIDGVLIPGPQISYDAPRSLIEPANVQIENIIPEYDALRVQMRFTGRERISSLYLRVADQNGVEQASLTINTINSEARIDSTNLKAGVQYVLTADVLGTDGSRIASSSTSSFTYNPIQVPVSIESYTLPTPQFNLLVITPTIAAGANVSAWRVKLVNETGGQFENWEKRVDATSVLRIEAPNMPNTQDASVFLQVEALDKNGAPINGAIGKTAQPVLYRPPTLIERIGARLSANPLNLLVAFIGLFLLILGTLLGIRILDPKKEKIKKITGLWRKPIFPVETPPIPCSLITNSTSAGSVALRIAKTPYVLGRDRHKCDGLIPSKSVSRVHAVLEFRDGVWYIRDNNSFHGTLLNSAKIGMSLAPLNDDDQVSFGGFQMTFRLHDAIKPPERRMAAPRSTGKLRVIKGPASMPGNQVFNLNGGIDIIGRGRDATVVLPVHQAAGISSQHAQMERLSDGWQISDLNSLNGTFVDGRRLLKGESIVVQPGCVIGFGPQVIMMLEA